MIKQHYYAIIIEIKEGLLMHIAKSTRSNGSSAYLEEFSVIFESASPFEIKFSGNSLSSLIQMHIPEFEELEQLKELVYKDKIRSQNNHLCNHFKYKFSNTSGILDHHYSSELGGYDKDDVAQELFMPDPEAYRKLFVETYKKTLAEIYSENRYYMYKRPVYEEPEYWIIKKDSIVFEDEFSSFCINKIGVDMIVKELKAHLEKYAAITLQNLNDSSNDPVANYEKFSIDDYNGFLLMEIEAIEQAKELKFDMFEKFMEHLTISIYLF